jgi:alkanesulfonate monooxygenase SsuD/methylene tetrahydromethanopterin reductase-like flavin-dependent oxidoreductase (luciferase family)
MDIGIGLPTTLPGTTGDQVVEWAKRADAAGFSSLATIDRLVYPNYEPLVALGAAAAVTERARLLTAIALLPWRQNAALVAKQTATVHVLSGGRLVLGAAVGGRRDDFEASGVPMEGRGKRIEEMLEEIKRLWAGEERGYAGGVGPDVSSDPPPIVVGGQVDAAFRRAALYGDGWIMGGGPPESFGPAREKLEAAFRHAGRKEKPRALAISYFSLDADAEEQTRRGIGSYYSFVPEYEEYVVGATPKGEDEIRERVRAFEQQGCDELVLFPASAHAEQVDRLAAIAL